LSKRFLGKIEPDRAGQKKLPLPLRAARTKAAGPKDRPTTAPAVRGFDPVHLFQTVLTDITVFPQRFFAQITMRRIEQVQKA